MDKVARASPGWARHQFLGTFGTGTAHGGGGCLCTQFGLKNTYIEDGGSKYYRVFGLHTNAIYESGFVLSSACCFRKEFVSRGTRQI